MPIRTLEQARSWRAKLNSVISTADDETALNNIELFNAWQSGIAVTVNQRVRYNDALYKCIQAHTTQEDWTPDITPALWVRVTLDEWPEWVQPTGAHDAYNKGDKVTFEGTHYISLTDGNVYSPTAYPAGWEAQD
jgi:hypothetical protein